MKEAITYDANGNSIGIGTMVRLDNGRVNLVGQVDEIQFRRNGDVMLHITGRPGRSFDNVKYVEVMRLTEAESVVSKTFLSHNVKLTVEEISKVTAMLRLAFESDGS